MPSTDPSRSDLSRPDDFVRWLRAEGAHHDLVSYVEGRNENLDAFWATCPRGDWMLALLARDVTATETLVALAAKLAQIAKDQLSEEASLARDELAQLAMNAEIEPSRIAALEAEAERQADPAAHHAMLAVLIAARSRSAPQEVPNLVPLLVQAAVFDAGECAYMAVIGYVQRQAAEIIRAEQPHLRVSAG